MNNDKKKKSTAKSIKGRKTSKVSKEISTAAKASSVKKAPVKKARAIERVGAGIRRAGNGLARKVQEIYLNSKLEEVKYTLEQLASATWKRTNGFVSKRIEGTNVRIMTLAEERRKLFDWIANKNEDGLVKGFRCAGLDMMYADLTGFIFEQCTILAGKFEGAVLANVTFVDCILSGTVFSKASGLESCKFIRCKMVHTTFVDVTLGIVKHCILNRSYIQVAYLGNTDFEGCTLDRVKFEAIVDEEANFSKAKSMHMAKFDGYSGNVYELFSIARRNELNLTHTKAKLRRTGRGIKSTDEMLDDLFGMKDNTRRKMDNAKKSKDDAEILEIARKMLENDES